MLLRKGTVIAALLALFAGPAVAQPKAGAAAPASVDPDTQMGMESGKYTDPDAISTVYFALGSARLTASATGWLDDAVLRLQKIQGPITVGGHTDAVGEAAYNQDLSNRRAAVVREYLIAHGVAADRLLAVGYGKTQPIDSNAYEEGRMHNRRVELKAGIPP